jgi:hypothetical protein
MLGFARCHHFTKSKCAGGLACIFAAANEEMANFLFRAPETFYKLRGHGMNVDEYSVGVFAYLLIFGHGVIYPRSLPAKFDSEEQIYSTLKKQKVIFSHEKKL